MSLELRLRREVTIHNLELRSPPRLPASRLEKVCQISARHTLNQSEAAGCR